MLGLDCAQELRRPDYLHTESSRARQVSHIIGYKILNFGFTRQLNKWLVVRIGSRRLPCRSERTLLCQSAKDIEIGVSIRVAKTKHIRFAMEYLMIFA